MVMRTVRTAAALVAVLVVLGLAAFQLSAAAQSAPATSGFSGQWVLVDARPVRPGYEQFWMGTEATITQTPETFEISRVTPSEPVRQARFVFGKEVRNSYVVNGGNVHRDSRTTLRDGLLLISTDTTTDTEPRRRTNILRWSIDANGELAINDTEMCGKGECPSIITNLRFKRK